MSLLIHKADVGMLHKAMGVPVTKSLSMSDILNMKAKPKPSVKAPVVKGVNHGK